MSPWDRFVLPRLVNWACGVRSVDRQRAKVIPRARGRVLEIGIGSGLNFPHYDPEAVTEVVGVDPSAPLLEDARRAAGSALVPVTLEEGTAEALPVADASVDTVVTTYTLCSVPDVDRALSEVRRVLCAGGALLFCEHGLAPDEQVRRWQRRLTPVWKRIGGGCNLDLPVPGLLEAAGFHVDDLETMYLPGLRFMNFNYWGLATASPSADQPRE